MASYVSCSGLCTVTESLIVVARLDSRRYGMITVAKMWLLVVQGSATLASYLSGGVQLFSCTVRLLLRRIRL